MSVPALPPLLADLTADMILACDRQGVVYEANAAAWQMLGTRLVGKPFLELLTTMTRAKGEAFLAGLGRLQPGETSEPWELHFQRPRANPVLVHVRGGVAGDQSWLIVGTGAPARLTALYHEALAINSDLTNLIRQLTKEQALLRQRLERLLGHRRATAMVEEATLHVADRLDDLREELTRRVADRLVAELPMIGIPGEPGTQRALHIQRMVATAQRFHDVARASMMLDWSLFGYEYRWAAQVLKPMGFTWEHQRVLIDAYFSFARDLGGWSEEEQEELGAIAAKLLSIGAAEYEG